MRRKLSFLPRMSISSVAPPGVTSRPATATRTAQNNCCFLYPFAAANSSDTLNRFSFVHSSTLSYKGKIFSRISRASSIVVLDF